MQGRDADVDPRELMDLYMQGARAIGEAMHRVTVRHDLTPMQAMTLLRVGGDTVPTKDIARHLHCDPSNATGLVDQLERRGLVRRTTPPHDRRVRAVEATEQGAAVLADLRAAMASGGTVLDRLDAADRAELRRILLVLTATAEPAPA
jgi:DNA-binding MarR family transcriptional regulator